MPHPQSPHWASPVGLSDGLDAVQHSKEPFCAPLPLHRHNPLHSSLPRHPVAVPPMATTVQDTALSSDHRALPITMSLDEPGAMQWPTPSNFPINHLGQNTARYLIPSPLTSGSGDFHNYAQNGMSYNENYDFAYPPQYPSSSYPQSYNALDIRGLPNTVSMPDSYPPTAYLIEPQKHHDSVDLSDQEINRQLMQLSNDYEHHHLASHIKIEEQNGYQSPYSDLSRASTPHDDPPQDHNAEEAGTIDKEQPYAQLIYRALLDAPDHTMILRDIYDWFKRYTDKASASETKGWQNSIRHNLSMNGAFEKVDQPYEDSRKGFLWRLTDDAIREGVKSTTRYRSKQPNKRGHRTHPQPQRQASGAKGGQAARRSARMRRSNRVDAYRSDPYTSRSVPATFDPTFNNQEVPMPYPQSPFHGSEVDCGYGGTDGDFNSLLVGPGVDSVPTARSYTGSPTSHGLPIMDTEYGLYQSPTESLFTNSHSPSPTADEPRTPVNQGMWTQDVSFGAPSVFDELAYREYAG